jgi:hypothetical protein
MLTDYFKQRQEYRAMASRTEEAAQMLAQIPTFPADLEEKLSDVQSSYKAVQNSFPDQLNTTAIINAILKLADDTGVKAIPLITQPWTPEIINNQDYSVFRLSITASGDFAGLASFVDQLENGEPTTLVIESMLIDQATEITDGETVPPCITKLEIAVYSRPLAADENKGIE